MVDSIFESTGSIVGTIHSLEFTQCSQDINRSVWRVCLRFSSQAQLADVPLLT